MVVDSVNMLDGNVYLVSQGDNIKPAGATDFDNVINLSLIHISEPTRPY